MNWTYEIASVLGSAPWEDGMTKAELIEFAERNGASRTLSRTSKNSKTLATASMTWKTLASKCPPPTMNLVGTGMNINHIKALKRK